MIAVVPDRDLHLFAPITAERKNLTIIGIPDWSGAGYFWQQWVKINADTYTDAAIICHLDSDVFVKAATHVRDYFHDNKPAWLWSYYTDAIGNVPWQAPTKRAFGADAPREFMQGFPFLIHRSSYPLFRKHIELVHGVTTEAYIRDSATRGPTAFSEFNLMGCVAYAQQNDSYHWVDRNRDEWPKGFQNTRQFWSHAPLKDCLPEIEQMLDGRRDHQLEVTNRGIWVIANDTHISEWVKQAQRLDFDTPTLEKHLKFIKPGDTVVDCGANIGDNTIAYARATAGVSTGQVIAFEPNPLAFECLRRNMAGHSHVQCENVGLGDVYSNVSIVIGPNAGAAHLEGGTGSIPVRLLDSWNLPRLAFLKIDIEGYELRMLKGAEATINRCRPVMYIEINAGALARAGTSPEEVRSWLVAHGYRIEGWQEGHPQYDIFAIPQ